MDSSSAAYSPDDPLALRRTSRCPLVSWGAIFAGFAGALALHILFVLLGAGLGFAIYSPLTDAKPIADLGTGAMIIQGLSAIISLWFGGWMAGRFTPAGLRSTAWLHGFAVWCTSTIAGVLVVATGAGWAGGALSNVVGGGLSLAGKPAAAAVDDAAKAATEQSKGALTSFTDEALGSRASDATKGEGIRAKRDVTMAVGHLFSPLQADNRQANRAAVVQALVKDTGASEAEANRMVNEWIASYDQLQADLAAAKEAAAAKAREAADEAAKALTIFSLCAFFGFFLGALGAACGGRQGGKMATKCDGYVTG